MRLLLSDPHLLHENLWIIRNYVSVHNRPKGDVIAGRLDVLVHQLSEVLAPQAVNQVSRLCVGATHLPGQDLGVLEGGVVVNGPAGDGCATLCYGPVEQT